MKQDGMTWHLWIFNWYSRRSEDVDTESADALECFRKHPVQGDRLVPWSTSDGQGQAEMGCGARELPFTGNLEAFSEEFAWLTSTVIGYLDDVIALGGPGTLRSVIYLFCKMRAT